MLKKLLSKSFLLLFALAAGTGSVWADDSYTQITNLSDLDTDATYIIADISGNTANAFGALTTQKRGTIIASGLSVSGTTITVSSSATDKPLEFTFTKSGDYYTIASGENYLGYSSGTAFTTSTSVPSSNSYKWNVAYNDTYKCLLINNANSTARYILRNASSAISAYSSTNLASYGKSTLYKKVTASGPVDPVVTIGSESVVVGSTTTISGPSELSMTFSSNAEGVATVDVNGVVTGVSVGTATITATWAAVANAYNAGTKQFTVSVVEASIYKKVTNSYQLVPGNEYILVATGNNKAMGAVGSNIRDCIDVTITDDEVTIIDENVVVLTLGGSKDEWTFLASDNDEYLAYSGSSNQVHSNSDATADASKWIITDDFELESANVSGRVLRYNSGSPRFACYSSGQQKAVLFIKVPATLTKNVSDAGWATYVPEFAVEFNADEAFIIELADDSETVLTEVSSVPAGTPVLLKGAGNHTLNIITNSTTNVSNNCLKLSDGTISKDDKVYVLANGKYGVGFYLWIGNENIPFGKVYMVPNANTSREFFSLFSDATGIDDMLEKTKDMKSKVFSLSGQRVVQPTKGLYIVNGKKVIIK